MSGKTSGQEKYLRAARPLACGLLSAVALNAPAIPLDEVQLLREEIAHLRAQIAWLKQKLFGGGQSEKLDRAQLLLKLGELEKLATVERPSATITYERAAGAAAPRGPAAEHFAHLPVRETVEIIPPAVQAQPEAYKKIGEERTFEVDVVRPKFKRRDDRTQAPLIAPAPVRAVAGGYASEVDCSRGSRSPNTSITHRSIGSNKCRGAGAPRSPGRPWPTGSGLRPSGWNPAIARCIANCSKAATSRPTKLPSDAMTRTTERGSAEKAQP